MGGFDQSVYVDISAMEKWAGDITNISDNTASILDSMMSLVESLEPIWQGNSASAYIDAFKSSISDAKASHSKSKDFSGLLHTVVDTLNNE